MKRVIEIDKDMFNVLRNAEDMDCEVSAEAHIINKSLSLNGLLDMIIAEIEMLSCVSFTMGNGEVVETPLVNKDVVANIVKKYKEREGK